MDNSYKDRYLENSTIKSLLFSLVYNNLEKETITQMVESFDTFPVSFKERLYPDINFVNGTEGLGIRIQLVLDYLHGILKTSNLNTLKAEEVVTKLQQEAGSVFTLFDNFSKSMNKISQKFYSDGEPDSTPSEYDLHVAQTYDLPMERIFIDENIIYSNHPFIVDLIKHNLDEGELQGIVYSSYESVTWLSELQSGLHFKKELKQEDLNIWLSVFELAAVFYQIDNPLGAFVNKKLKEARIH